MIDPPVPCPCLYRLPFLPKPGRGQDQTDLLAFPFFSPSAPLRTEYLRSFGGLRISKLQPRERREHERADRALYRRTISLLLRNHQLTILHAQTSHSLWQLQLLTLFSEFFLQRRIY